MKEKRLVNLDEDIENADWVKQSWDLPDINSEDFKKYLENEDTSMEDFKKLPVYRYLLRQRR